MRRWVNLLAFWVSAILLGACAGPAPGAPLATAPAPPASSPVSRTEPTAAPTSSPAARRLRVAVLANVTAAPFLVALERGYFTEAQLDLEIVPLGGGAEMVGPLSTGELDAAIGGMSAGLFNALARGVDARIVADFSRMSRGHGFGGLLVRNDVPYTDPTSLRGQRVAVNNPGSPCHYMVGKLLEAAGMAMEDVELVSIPFPTVPGAFAKREIEAACAAEPWVANTVRTGEARLVLTFDEVVPDMQVSVVMASPALLRERLVAERFLAAFLRAASAGREKSPETLEVVSKHTGIEVPVLEQTYWTDVDPQGRVNVASIRDQIAFFTRLGLVQGTVDLERIVDQSYLPRS
ncbi:MAG: ABC transporter substrate-binding protein [Chloroflexi bacterium]|nr:ABC transporter substrate-binding protein [Chloroflexota bacterium]